MQSTDRAAFKTLLTDALAFYRQDVSIFALTVWWQACQPFELEQVAKALTAHAMDPERGRFPPMPADLARVLQGTRTDRSLMAWAKVMDAIRAAGAWRSVAFDDPAIHAAIVDIGGWVAVCTGQADDLPHLQRRFCDSHKAYTARGEFEFPPLLDGEFDAENRLNGFATKPPVLIGDPNMAQQVIERGRAGPRTRMTELGAALPAPESTRRLAQGAAR